MTSLALKYRPRTFGDLTGQKHVRVVLQQMCLSQDVPAALIFSGSRGTGKTTSARIFACGLNCESLTDKGDPCGECGSCVAITSNRSLDVIEIDAASNGQVGEIRKIKEMVAYAQTGKWRVVILDEAHSMSREAFNALLKVLEEPPAQTVFILATTEPSKIIDTVHSRSMSFDFRRLPIAQIIERLEHICSAEHISADDGLLAAIADRCQGGMRDAIMTLEQCNRMNVRTDEDFRDMFGIIEPGADIILALIEGDIKEALDITDDVYTRTGDVQLISNDLTAVIVRSIRHKAGAADPGIAHVADKLSQSDLVRIARQLWDIRRKTRLTDSDTRTSIELAIVSLAGTIKQDSSSLQSTQSPETKLSLAEMMARTA